MNEERLYRLILANLPVGFSRVDRDGRIAEFNKAAEIITGYTREEVLGKPHLALLHGPEATVCPLFESLRQLTENVATEATITTKSEKILTLSVTSFPLFDEKNTFLGGVEIFRDIDELKRLERERQHMLSMFAHDMKNPVVAALGFLNRILAGKKGPLTEPQKTELQHIHSNLKQLENLARDFLDFSRYEASEYKPEMGPLDLVATISEQMDEISIKAEQENITLKYEGPQTLPIHADAAMLARTLANLLDNAVRYTKPEGTVTARLNEQEEEVLVQVEDNGTGIPQERLPFVFDAFYRVSKDTKGSGLGLAVAKSIVKAHGGKIWIESTPNRGTTVSFTLPKRQ
ncbi:MAG: PAS domain-containing sensor histidine kinase [Deltaproteobacteria bacterium]